MPWTDLTTKSQLPLWRRTDGATVRWDNGPSKLNWIAFRPDPSEDYLEMRQGELIRPRRWKTEQAAMIAVDREFPEIESQASQTHHHRPENRCRRSS
jgi:hypothetical protein